MIIYENIVKSMYFYVNYKIFHDSNNWTNNQYNADQIFKKISQNLRSSLPL